MKVGIVTFHFVNNFGGALQAYALQKAVSQVCDVETEIIDYRNWFIRLTDTVRMFPISTNIAEIKSGLKTMKQRFGRKKKFANFINTNCQLSRYYGNSQAIKLHSPGCDKYICGSDQIWNPYLTFGVVNAYFLGWVKEEQNKISYAPSFGTSNTGSIFEKRMKKYLSSFGSISVREQEGIDFVEKLTGKEAIQLIDPTFLLSSEDWEEIAITPKISGKYMLLYIMQQDEEMYSYARKLKERLGLQLVEISRYGYKPDFVDVSLVDVGPSEFIGLFKNADYICTNSYHGFVFSVLFEKEFCLIPCKRFRVRIENLAKLFFIELPAIDENIEPKDMHYDKENVRQIIEVEKQKALEYLQNNIVQISK